MGGGKEGGREVGGGRREEGGREGGREVGKEGGGRREGGRRKVGGGRIVFSAESLSSKSFVSLSLTTEVHP